MPFVRGWKERGLRHLAPLAADLMVARLARPEADVITYIPADPLRQLERSHHPAQALAGALAARWGLDGVPLLQRARPTRRQAAQPLALRAGNVRGAFAATDAVPGRVLLVDDVYTSGSTASAGATALRRAGARHVDVVTFARALR